MCKCAQCVYILKIVSLGVCILYSGHVILREHKYNCFMHVKVAKFGLTLFAINCYSRGGCELRAQKNYKNKRRLTNKGPGKIDVETISFPD